WVNGMIAYYLVAITPWLLWTIWRSPAGRWRGPLLAVAAALCGAAPLLVYNLRHGFATLAFLFGGNPLHSGPTLSQVWAVFAYFWRACLPELTGAWQPYTLSSGLLGGLLLALYGASFAALIAEAGGGRPLPLLLIVLACCVPLVFAASGFG